MLARGSGVLVHIASIAAGQPQGMSGAYSASKAGVAMLSRQLAFEWGPRGIRSNTVSAGLIRTALSESFYQAPGVKERRKRSCHQACHDVGGTTGGNRGAPHVEITNIWQSG